MANLHPGMYINNGSQIAEVVEIKPTKDLKVQFSLYNQDGTVTEQQMPVDAEVEVLNY